LLPTAMITGLELPFHGPQKALNCEVCGPIQDKAKTAAAARRSSAVTT
jgi:hypothetical protein